MNQFSVSAGDGGGATWDDIIAGSKGKAEDEKDYNIKTKSAEDVPILAKSFRLKGEFSKSLGTFYHLPPPNSCPKNDVKTKIYWYHRRKELKAQKDKMKSQSADSLHQHHHQHLANSATPSTKNHSIESPNNASHLTKPNSQRILLQIQQQEKQLQQQHKDQLQKVKTTGGGERVNLPKSK